MVSYPRLLAEGLAAYKRRTREALDADVTAVRDAVGTLIKHPITETKVTEVYAYN